ncbi:serine hydrolase [Actinomadura welshii]|uniref:serine hydrolase n=1 Tax=Actinomadura welshii TaxID=3103817 RepID=UPI0003ACE49D|nr:serine hydrolase [Actinomadura madurae]
MRRHLITLVLAAGATGAGAATYLAVADGPNRRSGVTVNASESVRREPAGRRTTAARATTRPFDAAALRRAVRAYFEKRPGEAGIMATDLKTGLAFGENEQERFVSASVMKVDILASLLLQRQRDQRRLSDGQRDLAERMIRESDNSAADALYSAAGGGAGVRKANAAFGLKQTKPFPGSWGSSWTSPADQVRLLRHLASDRSALKAPGRRYILGLMGSVMEEQAWGISAAARPGEKVALKNGWTPVYRQGHGWAVNSVGRITGADHDFLIAVCSGGNPTMGSGVATVEHVADMVADTMRASHA